MCSKLTAHGEKLRGGGGGETGNRHQFLWKPPLRPRRANFLLCWSTERWVEWRWGVALELKTEKKTPYSVLMRILLFGLLVEISSLFLLPPSPSPFFPTPLLAQSDSSPGFLTALLCPLQAPSVSIHSGPPPKHTKPQQRSLLLLVSLSLSLSFCWYLFSIFIK